MCYDCHILERIVYRKGIDNELIESLNEIANQHQIELKELDED